MERKTFLSKLQRSAEQQAERSRVQNETAAERSRVRAQSKITTRLAAEDQRRKRALLDSKTEDLQAHLAARVRETGRECAEVLAANGILPGVHWNGWERRQGIRKLLLSSLGSKPVGVWVLSKDASKTVSLGGAGHGLEVWRGIGTLWALGLTATGEIISAQGSTPFEVGTNKNAPATHGSLYPDINRLWVKGLATNDQLVSSEEINPTGEVEEHQFILDAWEKTFLDIAAGRIS